MEENMKKLSTWAVLTAGLVVGLALSLVGCADISGNGTASEGYKTATSSAVTKSLTLNVTSTSDLIDFSNSSLTEEGARTIAPDAVDSSALDFYLNSYDIIGDSDKGFSKVTFVGSNSSTTEGTITVELDASNYRFTLIAVPTGTSVGTTTTLKDLIDAAYLIGYATADLRYTEEAASVNFVLSSDGLSGESSSLDLSVYLDNWSTSSLTLEQATGTTVISAATIGLYDIQSGAVDSDTLVTGFDLTGCVNPASAKKYYGTTANNAVVTTLNAGTYDLTVTFTLMNGKKFIYSEPLILLPNQKTTATIAIPEVIDLPPVAPTNFKVGYIAPEYNDSDYYKLVFNWDDNSNNELFFELDLYDITTTAALTPAFANSSTNWTNSSTSNTVTYSNSSSNPNTTSKATTVFYGLKQEKGPNWYAGSLNRNNKEAVFYVELGKRYFARIRAVNSAGNSEYATSAVVAGTYASAAVGTDTTTAGVVTIAHDAYCIPAATTYTVTAKGSTAESAYLADGKTETATAFNSELINLFRVTYELSGGAFTSPASLDTIYYFDQIVNGNPIMQPDSVRVIALETGIVNSDPLVYNGSADEDGVVTNGAITLKYGESTAAKKWTSWKQGSISGDTYPSNYTQCTTTTSYNEDETYYTQVSSSYAVTVLTEEPADWTQYYTATLKPYTGYTNLVLYANYTSNTFGVTIKNVADYLIESNMGFKATLSGSTGATPKFKVSSSDKLGTTTVYPLWTSYYTPVTVTAAMISATTGDYYTTNDGADTAVTWESLSEGDTIYSKAATATTTTNQYLIIDRTQIPVTYTKTTVTGDLIHGGANDLFQAYTAYKKTDSTFWDSATTSTQVYPGKSSSNAITLTNAMITAGKNGYFYESSESTYTETDAAFWASAVAGTTKVYTNDSGAGETAVTAAMIAAATNVYYQAYTAYKATDATFWASAVENTTLIYSDSNGTPYSDNSGKVSADMIAGGKNTYVTTNDGTDTKVTWSSVSASDEVYLRTASAAISAKNLVINYSYNTEATSGADAFGTYEKLILEVVQQGTQTGTSVGTYTYSGNTFTVPLSSFTTGTYIATFKAYLPSSNNKQPYEYSVYLQIND